ncbi:hypothetical protein MNBD_NITROSPIRAE01-1634 [hydrothermal vent metagenome]|uniref:Uncharacterized protein n=1 Tax=hydrothermal vent metagenome TaxID=652676 RepID=A0A3B1CKV9_9ZZZZ
MEDDLKKQGYSKEEEYFYKLNQALLEKTKKKSEETQKSEIDKDEA